MKQLVLRISTVVMALVPFISIAQLKDSLILTEDGWIEKMDDYVGVKLSMSNDTEVFAVETDGLDFEIFPNTTTFGKVHINYKFISLNLKFAPDFFPGNGDNETKGKTSSFGISANLIFRHWFHNLSYSRVKGFYINNTKDLDPTWVSGDPYAQVPDLVFKNFEGITGYSFNPKFSVRSITTQTERQVKSAGSFVPILGYRYYIIDNRDEDASSSQKSNNFEFVLGVGYHYNFVLKQNFYFSLGVTPGVGYIFTKLTTRYQASDDLETRYNDLISRVEGRGALGYNSRAFFAGGLIQVTGSSYKQEGTTAVNTDARVAYQVFIGYRFNAPKRLRENVNQISKPIKKHPQ